MARIFRWFRYKIIAILARRRGNRFCYADLSLWAAYGSKDTPLNESDDSICRSDFRRNGYCICGKFRTPDRCEHLKDATMPGAFGERVDRK